MKLAKLPVSSIDDQNLAKPLIEESDVLNFSNNIEQFLEPYFNGPLIDSSQTLDFVIAQSDKIAVEVSKIWGNHFDVSDLTNIIKQPYPEIIGVGASKEAIQNIVNNKQTQDLIFDFQTFVDVSFDLIENFPNNTEQYQDISGTNLTGETFSIPSIKLDLITIDLSNLRSLLIDTEYISPGEAGL